MEGGIGTRYELDAEGRFTGRLDGPFMYGEGKLEGMRGFAEAHDIDLAESWAYSDSASDLPMLRAVGNAVVGQPRRARCSRSPAPRAGSVMRFEKLGRRLAIAGATLTAAAVGGGSALLARRRGARSSPLARDAGLAGARASASRGSTNAERERELRRAAAGTPPSCAARTSRVPAPSLESQPV